MKILIATDSFKGSLSSLEAGNAIADGIRRAGMPAEIQVSPIADGGEGTTEALVNGLSGYLETVTVSDPLGRKQTANYGILPSGTAVMEMAAAAGLPLLSESERNPLYTTTFGVGEMIADAIAKGCRKFIIGIGGSATNDGGVGCLQALGFSFRNADDTEIPCGAVGLSQLQKSPPKMYCRNYRLAHFRWHVMSPIHSAGNRAVVPSLPRKREPMQQ